MDVLPNSHSTSQSFSAKLTITSAITVAPTIIAEPTKTQISAVLALVTSSVRPEATAVMILNPIMIMATAARGIATLRIIAATFFTKDWTSREVSGFLIKNLCCWERVI